MQAESFGPMRFGGKMVFCLQDTFRLFDYRDKKPRPIRLPTMDNLPTIQEASSGVDCEEGSTTNQDTASVVEENVREKKSSTNDSKLVFCSRLGVVAVLLTTALVIAAMTYRVISKNEYETFKAEFEVNAHQLYHISNSNIKDIFLSMKTVSYMFTSAAHQSEKPLPFVTVKDFEAIGEGIRGVSKTSIISYSPLLYTQDQLLEWSEYSANNTNWITEGRIMDTTLGSQFQENVTGEVSEGSGEHEEEEDHHGHGHMRILSTDEELIESHDEHTDEDEHHEDEETTTISPQVYRTDAQGRPIAEMGIGIFSPLWQMSPVPTDVSRINFNLASTPELASVLQSVLKGKIGVLSGIVDSHDIYGHSVIEADLPTSLLLQPVFDELLESEENTVKGTLAALLVWRDSFVNVLPEGESEFMVVTESCGKNNTYKIRGRDAVFVGEGALHDKKYDAMARYFEFESDTFHNSLNFCHQHVYIFPTDTLKKSYQTKKPIHYAAIIVSMFIFAALIFFMYDWFVTNRQNKTEQKADQTSAIVRELFPGNVAAKLFDSERKDNDMVGDVGVNSSRKTIAELYPAATVLFADIAGFTAWSSTRDPHQVFMLLETIFQAFDSIAKKRGIYKVETIGDCYVAVCGVPIANSEHAVNMARFANQALAQFAQVVQRLEITLGPDTADLGMRIGLHSGPVTAGVLRGDRARFQLFGDTVNTASRIESGGYRGRIHLSEQTASELKKHGKEGWIIPREDMIDAKGKGSLQTYWLKNKLDKSKHVGADKSESSESEGSERQTASSESDTSNVDLNGANRASVDFQAHNNTKREDRIQRLVLWNSELLQNALKQIVTHRNAATCTSSSSGITVLQADVEIEAQKIGTGTIVADEVAEIIEMPPYVHISATSEVQLTVIVVEQLSSYVSKVASMYNDNPFHNFDHASHVTMSVSKLLTRIVAPQTEGVRDEILHDHTYGITSDPLTQFAVLLSALIHDLDHPGIPNGQLMKENPSLAARYQEKSVAEQNSVDLAWNALMLPEFAQLRASIYGSVSELRRFRQLLVNSVIATDIFDKDLGALRKNRWNKAFHESAECVDPQEDINRKATIVIEHIIQASDVAHTMQHWHVYQKWNQRLFNEMYQMYRDGRSDKDPSVGWYTGELGFFDHYIIPLAKKLKDCGVFGVSSDEYLTYAEANRREWAEKGQGIVDGFIVDAGA